MEKLIGEKVLKKNPLHKYLKCLKAEKIQGLAKPCLDDKDILKKKQGSDRLYDS